MKRDDLMLTATVEVDVSLPYRTYLPAGYGEAADAHPLLLFLHGAGERGSDFKALTSTALPRHIEDGELDLPFVTVCPQCPEGSWWDALALVALLDKAIADYDVDTARVYVTGLSMGGRGTWQLANIVADRLAAIAPICAPFMFVNTERFKRLPMWVFHGVMDPIVPIADSVKMVRMLRGAGCDVNFTTYANAEHDSWTETYTNPALYD